MIAALKNYLVYLFQSLVASDGYTFGLLLCWLGSWLLRLKNLDR